MVTRSKLTDRGRAAADWWRRHGGGLGGTVIADRVPPGAVPSAHTPESLIAHGSAPLPDGHAWSSYGGRWRTVKIGSTDQPTWGSPRSAVRVSISGIFFTIPASAVGLFAVGGGLGTLIAVAPLTIVGSLLLLTWLPAYRRRRAIPTHGVLTGQVVKRWTYESGGEDSTTYYCVCVDDGTSPEAPAFQIERPLYNQLRVGDVVTVDFNPRWHKAKQIQPVTPAPGPR